MQPTSLRRIAALLTFVAFFWTAPLAAQQPPARPPQKPAPRAAQAAPRTTPAAPRTAQAAPRSTAPKQAPAGKSAYGVRQAGGTEPAAAGAAVAATNQAPPGAVRNVIPAAPFQLTPEAQELLNQVLMKWQQQSQGINSFKCQFDRWEVNETFGPKEYNYVLSQAKGYIKYSKPDKGTYRISEQSDWNEQKKAFEPKTTGLDHWVCTGKSIFEFNEQKKQLIERQLAPHLQGKAITNGPLPFIFGANAEQLKQRYWMRDITAPDSVNKQVWLEAWPKFQQDAANFQHCIVILNTATFLPDALRIILPDGKNKQDYKFEKTQVDDPLAILKGDFLPPIKPLGWTYVFEAAQQPQQQPAPQQPAPPAGGVPTAERTAPAPRQ